MCSDHTVIVSMIKCLVLHKLTSCDPPPLPPSLTETSTPFCLRHFATRSSGTLHSPISPLLRSRVSREQAPQPQAQLSSSLPPSLTPPLPPSLLAPLLDHKRQNTLEKMMETLKDDETILQQMVELSNSLHKAHQVGRDSMGSGWVSDVRDIL